MKRVIIGCPVTEHSVDVLKVCVAALKYRVGLEVSGPEHWGT